MNNHLKPCDKACRYNINNKCYYGGWNHYGTCFLEWKEKTITKYEIKKKKVLDIGFVKTTYSDTRVEGLCEERPLQGGSDYSSEHGTSNFKLECPFCNYINLVYIWSFRGGGKRCEHCGAIFGIHGAYRKKV